MNKYEIVKRIENFAPPETQEDWDCSGWIVDLPNKIEINKIMLCLTVTENVINQALTQNCDMIISHHPIFCINLHSELISEGFNPKLNIYCAHTNLDKVNGGTTDTLIEKIGLEKYKIKTEHEFLRIIDYKTSVENFSKILKRISKNSRLINPHQTTTLNKIAFCSGSGSEFIDDAKNLGADCLVTGDLKFHTALESPIVVYDIGHFESEIASLQVFEKLIENCAEIIYAKEKSPFEQL